MDSDDDHGTHSLVHLLTDHDAFLYLPFVTDGTPPETSVGCNEVIRACLARYDDRLLKYFFKVNRFSIESLDIDNLAGDVGVPMGILTSGLLREKKLTFMKFIGFRTDAASVCHFEQFIRSVNSIEVFCFQSCNFDMWDGAVEPCVARICRAFSASSSRIRVLRFIRSIPPAFMKACVRWLQEIPSLRVLDLTGNRLDRDSSKALSTLIRNTCVISELDLADMDGLDAFHGPIWHALSTNTSIARISFQRSTLGRGFFVGLRLALQKNVAIRTIEFHANSVSADDFKLAKVNHGVTSLKLVEMHLQKNDYAALFDALGDWRGLKELDLSNNALRVEDVESLARLVESTESQLMVLKLSACRLNDESAALLIGAIQRSGRSFDLDLGGNSITNLPPLGFRPDAFVTLMLDGNALSIKAGQRLAGLVRKSAVLQTLGLKACGMERGQFEALAEALARSVSLLNLDLRSNHADLDALRTLIPGLAANRRLQSLSLTSPSIKAKPACLLLVPALANNTTLCAIDIVLGPNERIVSVPLMNRLRVNTEAHEDEFVAYLLAVVKRIHECPSFPDGTLSPMWEIARASYFKTVGRKSVIKNFRSLRAAMKMLLVSRAIRGTPPWPTDVLHPPAMPRHH